MRLMAEKCQLEAVEEIQRRAARVGLREVAVVALPVAMAMAMAVAVASYSSKLQPTQE